MKLGKPRPHEKKSELTKRIAPPPPAPPPPPAEKAHLTSDDAGGLPPIKLPNQKKDEDESNKKTNGTAFQVCQWKSTRPTFL